MMGWTELKPLLSAALAERKDELAFSQTNVLRLFSGFYEGFPEICADKFASTLVISDFSKDPSAQFPLQEEISAFYCANLPEIQTVLLKRRFSLDYEERRGIVPQGSRASLDQKILEWNISYAIDLRLNQDYSFYPDCSLLRKWIMENSAGKTVLNTFAYTGTLGVAALAGNASYVIQTDLNQRFLSLSEKSAGLNQTIDPSRQRILAGDFFKVAGMLRKKGCLFDLVILDPPFFSRTKSGKVDMAHSSVNLINKIRPLVADGGAIIVINNALYLSGKEYLRSLEPIFQGICLQLEKIIPIPESIAGYSRTPCALPADPAPFNHSTKIILLSVKRKDGGKSTLSNLHL